MYNNNPYLNTNPYIPNYNFQQPIAPPQQKVKIVRVNGENGARAYQLPPGSEALVLDETAAIVWLVQTDDAGYKTVTPYDVLPHQQKTEPDAKEIGSRIDSIDQRLKKIEEALA